MVSNCFVLDIFFWIEFLSVVFSLCYLYFLIKQNIICWIFGIIGSLLSIYLFYHSRLYSEAILYSYYVFMGFYGYHLWGRKSLDSSSLLIVVNELKWYYHFIFISVCSMLALSLAWFFENYSDADKPFVDAFTTVFSFLATYLEAIKVLSAWLYWIVLNGVTIWLYFSKGLDIYATLSILYFVMSFVGYINWKKTIV